MLIHRNSIEWLGLGLGTFLLTQTASADVTTGLIANWPMNDLGPAVTVQDVAGGNSCSNENVSTEHSGAPGYGKAFYFNGSNAGLSCQRDASLLSFGSAGNLSFTVSAWVRFVDPNVPNEQYMFLSYDTEPGGPYGSVGLRTYRRSNGVVTGGVLYRDNAGNTISLTGTTSVTDGGWHMVTAVREGNSHSVYVDGQVADSAVIAGIGPVTGGGASGNFIRIGCEHTAEDNQVSPTCNPNETFFNGFIDDVRVYNRGLSPGDVQELYNYSPNQSPTGEAGLDQRVHLGNPVILDGSASTDPDGDALTYRWALVEKPIGSVASILNTTNTISQFTPDKLGDYVIELKVTDTYENSDTDYVTISTENVVPIADAGQDQLATYIGETIHLDGTQSYDDDGDDLDYSWAISVPAGFTAPALSNPNSPTAYFVVNAHTDFTITLTVSDGISDSVPKDTVVSFSNIEPVADCGFNETVVAGQTAILLGTASTDANNDTLTYAWAITNHPVGSVANIVNPSSSSTSLQTDLPGNYVVTLQVDDNYGGMDACDKQVYAQSIADTIKSELSQLIDDINAIDAALLKNHNLKNTLTNKINTITALVDQGDYDAALQKLTNDVANKTDGCETAGSPDRNDWIQSCEAQDVVSPRIQLLIQLLHSSSQ